MRALFRLFLVLRRNIRSSISVFLRVAALDVFSDVYFYVYPRLLRRILIRITYTYTSTYYVYVYRRLPRLLPGLLLFFCFSPVLRLRNTYTYMLQYTLQYTQYYTSTLRALAPVTRFSPALRRRILHSICIRIAPVFPLFSIFAPASPVSPTPYVYVYSYFRLRLFLFSSMFYVVVYVVVYPYLPRFSCSFGSVRGSSSSYVYVTRRRQLHMSPVKLPTVMSRTSTTHFWHFSTYSSAYSSTYSYTFLYVSLRI